MEKTELKKEVEHLIKGEESIIEILSVIHGARLLPKEPR